MIQGIASVLFDNGSLDVQCEDLMISLLVNFSRRGVT